MSEIIGLLKKGTSSQKKIYLKYIENRTSNVITYKAFKRENVELLELKKYVSKMREDNYLTKSEVNNIFKYLVNNLKYSKYSNVKNLVKIIKQFREEILYKMSDLNDYEKNTFNSLKHILFHIDLLRELIARKINVNYDSLDRTIKFENLIKEIINKDNIDYPNKAISLIIENIEILNHHDHKGRTFNHLLYDAILNSRINEHKKSLVYYKEILNFIVNIKSLNIDKNLLIDLFKLDSSTIEYGNALDNKIFDFKYDEKTGRYLLTDDFIVSIDNEGTKRYDDALSIEKTPYGSYILGIHITDLPSLGIYVNELLGYKNNINPNKMKASLEEFQKKNALSIFVEISRDGLIINYKLLKTRIEVDRNLLYDDFSKIITSDSSKNELTETSMNLISLYSVIKNEKLPKEPNINNIAELIVEKYMLLYGCIIGDMFAKKNIPGLYLNGENNLFSLDKTCYNAGFDNFDMYSRSTSPIYDNPSLLSQYLIHECILKTMSPRGKENLKCILKPIVDDMNKKRK